MALIPWQIAVPYSGLGALGADPQRVAPMRNASEILAQLPRRGFAPGTPVTRSYSFAEKLEIPRGEPGTRRTLEEMARVAAHDAHDPELIDIARAAVSHVPNKDYMSEASALYDLVRKTVQYRHDPYGLELVSAPLRVLLLDGAEDCDGHAACVAALAMALGHGAAFRTYAAEKDAPEEWSHVAPVIGVPQGNAVQWVVADTTEQDGYFGWEPEPFRVSKTKTWKVAG